MEEIVVAGLVGAGVGYLVRLGQEQIPRAVRGLGRNKLVAGTARRGREVLQAGVQGGMQVAQAGARGGVQVAQAGAKGGVQVARAGAKGGVQVAQAGAKGGVQVARAAVGRPARPVRRGATGRSRSARAVHVPVGEDAPTRRTAGRASEQGPAPGRETARRRQPTSQPQAPARSRRRTTP